MVDDNGDFTSPEDAETQAGPNGSGSPGHGGALDNGGDLDLEIVPDSEPEDNGRTGRMPRWRGVYTDVLTQGFTQVADQAHDGQSYEEGLLALNVDEQFAQQRSTEDSAGTAASQETGGAAPRPTATV